MHFYTPLGTWVMDVEGCLFFKNLRIFVAVYTVQYTHTNTHSYKGHSCDHQEPNMSLS